jgi:hypothetical protein
VVLIKISLITLFLLTSLYARENPFFPSQGEKDITYSSNQDTSLSSLKNVNITLPSQARVLEKVTVEFKNLDGSKESKSVELENSVDWHFPLVISQNGSTQTTKEDVKIPETKKAKQTAQKKQFEKIASIQNASFYVSGKMLKITSDDAIMRNFFMVKPHRIVLDFKRDANIKAFVQNNPNEIFSKIRVGNHSGYYRVVLELDGYYKYKLKKISGGYVVKLI